MTCLLFILISRNLPETLSPLICSDLSILSSWVRGILFPPWPDMTPSLQAEMSYLIFFHSFQGWLLSQRLLISLGHFTSFWQSISHIWFFFLHVHFLSFFWPKPVDSSVTNDTLRHHLCLQALHHSLLTNSEWWKIKLKSWICREIKIFYLPSKCL